MILGIQILGLIFGLFMLYLTFLHFKRKEFTIIEYIIWGLTWTAFIIVVTIPKILDPITQTLNISRIMDLLIIFGFMFIISTIFYIYGLIRKIQKKQEEIVREVAIQRKK